MVYYWEPELLPLQCFELYRIELNVIILAYECKMQSEWLMLRIFVLCMFDPKNQFDVQLHCWAMFGLV